MCIWSGGSATVTPAALVDLLGQDRLANGLGIKAVVQGPVTTLILPAAGWYILLGNKSCHKPKIKCVACKEALHFLMARWISWFLNKDKSIWIDFEYIEFINDDYY